MLVADRRGQHGVAWIAGCPREPQRADLLDFGEPAIEPHRLVVQVEGRGLRAPHRPRSRGAAGEVVAPRAVDVADGPVAGESKRLLGPTRQPAGLAQDREQVDDAVEGRLRRRALRFFGGRVLGPAVGVLPQPLGQRPRVRQPDTLRLAGQLPVRRRRYAKGYLSAIMGASVSSSELRVAIGLPGREFQAARHRLRGRSPEPVSRPAAARGAEPVSRGP